MRQTTFSLITAMLIFAAGCSDMESWMNEKQKAVDKQVEGRQETVNIQALDAVGYNGQAVRRSADKVLDMNDARQKELERVLK